MIVKSHRDIAGFIAGDASFIREILHPGKEPVAVGYSLAQAEVEPGGRTLPHRLTAAEVYVILEGRGRMHVGDEQAEVGAGQTVYIPPGAVQHIENVGTGRLTFLCLVEPAWTPDAEEVL